MFAAENPSKCAMDPVYMSKECPNSCSHFEQADLDLQLYRQCHRWAIKYPSECIVNPSYMHVVCRNLCLGYMNIHNATGVPPQPDLEALQDRGYEVCMYVDSRTLAM